MLRKSKEELMKQEEKYHNETQEKIYINKLKTQLLLCFLFIIQTS